MNHSFTQKLKKICSLLSIALIAFLLASSPIACSSSPTAGNDIENGDNDDDDVETTEVHMTDSAFTPSVLEIEVGTTVLWINTSSLVHTVTSGEPGDADGLFNSGNLAPDAEFTFTFEEPGSFNYFCIPHQPHMTGRIDVVE